MDLRLFLECYDILCHCKIFHKLTEEQKIEAVVHLANALDTAALAA